MLTLVSRRIATLRSGGLIAIAALCVTSGTGCTVLERWGNALFLHCAESHDLAEIRHDARSELSEQLIEERREAALREVELARFEAERRQLEREFCVCNEEVLRQQLRSNIREQLESKVAFNVTQAIEVGELEVDTEKLRELMVQREQPREQFQDRPKCQCCDQACRCGSGFLRRLCPHCRHMPCEAEKKCGGPEALEQLSRQPFRQPLRPAEIPLKLPVYLSFGMQQPEIERARIRQQPLLKEQFRQPCPCHDPAGGLPCVAPAAPAYQPPLQPTPQPAAPGANQPLTPPVPVADPSAQFRQPEARRVSVPCAGCLGHSSGHVHRASVAALVICHLSLVICCVFASDK